LSDLLKIRIIRTVTFNAEEIILLQLHQKPVKHF